MTQLGGDRDLAQKPIGPEGRGHLGPENLDRDLAVVLQVVGEIDRRHPATSELSLDGVAAGEGGVEALELIGWHDSTNLPGGPASATRRNLRHGGCVPLVLPTRSSGGAMSIRPVKSIIQSQPTIEGAGVKLRRAFGFGNTKDFDPFLLLDDFRNEHPQDYLAGFPWHPHRGIETITYVLSGTVQHGDSLGNRGTLGAGDVQWMTAGSGILHQEMPQGDAQGRMHGFQLWANLPSSLKMTAPRCSRVPGPATPTTPRRSAPGRSPRAPGSWGKTGPV